MRLSGSDDSTWRNEPTIVSNSPRFLNGSSSLGYSDVLTVPTSPGFEQLFVKMRIAARTPIFQLFAPAIAPETARFEDLAQKPGFCQGSLRMIQPRCKNPGFFRPCSNHGAWNCYLRASGSKCQALNSRVSVFCLKLAVCHWEGQGMSLKGQLSRRIVPPSPS